MTRLVDHCARQLRWRTATVAAATALLLVRATSASPSSHLAALAPAAPAGDLAWSDCGSISSAALSAVVRTECATFAAPLCHAGVCDDAKSRSVDVSVRRIKATTSPDSAPSVWLLQGGAGTLSPGLHEAMSTLFKQLGGGAHVYTMDQRGSGRSTRLECLDTATSTPLSGASVTGAQAAACAEQLEQTLGNGTDLAAFSITSAASDVAAFVAKHHATSKTFVYGVGYGAAIAERLLHLNAPSIAGYVLDAVRTAVGSSEKDAAFESMAATDFGDVASAFVDACTVGSPCLGRSATTSLRDTLTTMYSDFGAGLASRCAALVIGSASGDRQSVFAASLRAILAKIFVDEQARGLLAAFVHRLGRCNRDDVQVVERFLTRGLPSLAPVFDESDYTASLLYRVVAFSEMWESPAPTPDDMRSRFAKTIMSPGSNADLAAAHCSFTRGSSSACGAAAAATANATTTTTANSARTLTYKKDAHWNTAATIPAHASVLVVSSASDPLAPQKYATQLFRALNGTNKAMFTPAYVAHGSLWWSPLNRPLVSRMVATTPGMDALVAFVLHSGDLAKLRLSTTAPSAAATTPAKVVEELFSTTDAFDGVFTSASGDGTDSRAGGSDTSLVVGLVCAGAVLVLAGAATVYYRRRRASDRAQDQLKQCEAEPRDRATSPSANAPPYKLETRA